MSNYKGFMGGESTRTYTWELPYFNINGYDFNIEKDAESKSELNIVKTQMYVSTSNWGYNDIQFVNFTGEEIELEIYSRVTDTYTGNAVQPEGGGNDSFYSSDRTPHAVLKYWAQTGCTCVVDTNLQAYESGDYIITEFSQSSPEHDFIVTELTLTQYEEPGEISQTYWRSIDSDSITEYNTQSMSASALEVSNLGDHSQTCKCTADTPSYECTASVESEVATIQTYLRRFGYFPLYTRSMGLLECSGKYCYYTALAVSRLQEDYNISVTGEFNSEVRSVLLELLGAEEKTVS